MMQHHIAHLLVELFTSEFHRRTIIPSPITLGNFFTREIRFQAIFAGIVPHLGAHKLRWDH